MEVLTQISQVKVFDVSFAFDDTKCFCTISKSISPKECQHSAVYSLKSTKAEMFVGLRQYSGCRGGVLLTPDSTPSLAC